MTRRTLITGGIFAGAAAGAAAAAEGGKVASELDLGARSAEPQSSRGDEQTNKVLQEIRDELRLQRGACSPAGCPVVESIRAQQKTFLKNRGKFPDFIDIGIDVWESVYDWHVNARQKPEVARMQDGRYGMAFMLTTLVLRHDITGNYIGLGYDARGEQE